MDEISFLSQLRKRFCEKMDTLITNHKGQFFGQQAPQGSNDFFAGHMGAGAKYGKSKTLTSAIIDHHQNGDPGAFRERIIFPLFIALMPVQVFCLALPPSFLALLVALLPIDLRFCISGFLRSVFFPGQSLEDLTSFFATRFWPLTRSSLLQHVVAVPDTVLHVPVPYHANPAHLPVRRFLRLSAEPVDRAWLPHTGASLLHMANPLAQKPGQASQVLLLEHLFVRLPNGLTIRSLREVSLQECDLQAQNTDRC